VCSPGCGAGASYPPGVRLNFSGNPGARPFTKLCANGLKTRDQVTTTTQPIRAGLVKAYGATTAERLPTLAEVPTLSEQGLSEFRIAVWHGVYAPKATPEEIVDRLAGALRAALDDKGFEEAMARLGALPVSPDRASPARLQKQLVHEIERWTPIIQKAQICLD
jgi:tripartite-type tricarboxylate transporter receptor subunit TctC